MLTADEIRDILALLDAEPTRRHEHTPLSPAQIASLEADLGCPLPGSYRTFLETAGATTLFSAEIEDALGRTQSVLGLFGVSPDADRRSRSGDLLARRSVVDDPPGWIAIGRDIFGNEYFLCCSTGSIWFVEFSIGFDGRILIAPSFETFLRSLRPGDEDGT